MAEKRFPSLRAEIRHVVDEAESYLIGPAIYAALTTRCSKPVFGVTVAQMVDARQLSTRRAPKGSGAGVRFAYGPGPEPVLAKQYRADRPERVKGFMAMKREREARRRGAEGVRAAK